MKVFPARHPLSLVITISVFSFVSLGAGVFVTSCAREEKADEAGQGQAGEHRTPPGWKFALPAGDPAEGRKVFGAMECYKCHEIKGETFPGVAKGDRGVGPELSQMAGMHPLEYFAESIINPNAVLEPEDKEKGYLGEDGKSKMPNYNDILTVKQVSDLAAYLAALRGEAPKGH